MVYRLLRVEVGGPSSPLRGKAPYVCLLEMRHLVCAAKHFWARRVLVRLHWQSQLRMKFLMPCLEQGAASSVASPLVFLLFLRYAFVFSICTIT